MCLNGHRTSKLERSFNNNDSNNILDILSHARNSASHFFGGCQLNLHNNSVLFNLYNNQLLIFNLQMQKLILRGIVQLKKYPPRLLLLRDPLASFITMKGTE